ncbi:MULTISPECIES: triple tyrosine motif-containing protein [unclassified Polaribacter]|uniref:helix-turn-helix and ligand-binding sensor domain-containing protein n=1 Tax=unclassified Polaribacter TaxID=196858 RepID=UPI0011BE44DC|nr:MULTISPECIES: triple tyrosine motif-containing protein [unclassified Polaribacter]TXD51926.1 LuxR family transcriptional regulator [Polaribacter sp. IC063]TXD59730.1 LuxR family transcriptional regulator [Polaribacter sp. IC066]
MLFTSLKSSIIFVMYFFVFGLFSQEVPPINIFSTEDYGAENQNWAISQDANNFIYVANNKGLLEFNGANWQLYPTPNETIMRSVKCLNDKVYTGFYMDFGYWVKNDFGLLDYTSIVEENNIEMLEDEQIWEIFELDGWLLFKSLQRIYLYNTATKTFKVIEASKSITKLSKVENVIYFHDLGKGVFMIENGIPKLVSDNQILKENKIVEIFLKNDKLFFATQKKGFFFLEGKELKKWNISADASLLTKTIYSAKQLENGDIVLGTISNGFIKLYENGEINYQITQGLGLSNNTVLAIFEDVDKNIWLGLDNGINVVNLSSPFKLFVNKTSYWGTIYASIVHKDNLYLGTNQGLYYKKKNSDDDFKFITNTQGQVWNIQEIDGVLFCSHDSGTFIIKNKIASLIEGTDGTWGVKKIDDNTLIQGSYDGLYILSKNGESWKLRNKIKGFSNSSKYFILKDDHRVFVNHEYKGVFKLEIDKEFKNVTNISKDVSVAKGIHSSLIRYNNAIFYACKKGVYRYDNEKDSFKIDTVYSKLIPEGKFLSAKLLFDDAANKLWSFTKDDIRYFAPGKLSAKPDLEIIPIKGAIYKGASGYENIIHLEDKKYLIGTSDGYLLIDLNSVFEPKDFTININRIFYNEIDGLQNNVSLKEKGVFTVDENNIGFVHSVSNYNKTASIKYQYMLDGLNEKWSKLSKNNSFLFENLPFGEYTFKVRASIDNKLSQNVAAYNFKIAKPWYLSNVLVFIYVVVFCILFFTLHIITKTFYKRQRVNLLEKTQRDLELKELESSQKIIKLNNDKLRSDIESKNRELATSTMSIIKKNEFLNTIKTELTIKGKEGIDKVVKIIDQNLNNTDDWKLFQEAFNNADKNFLKKIKSKHPELTPNDLRLCAYLRLNLSSKEIAPLLNISPRSVEVKRYRLRKKMNLPHDANLTNYIIEI